MFPEKMPRHLPWQFLAIRIYQTLVTSTIVSFTEKAFDQIYWRKAFRVYDYLCPSSVRNYSNRLARNLPPLTQLQTYIYCYPSPPLILAFTAMFSDGAKISCDSSRVVCREIFGAAVPEILCLFSILLAKTSN